MEHGLKPRLVGIEEAGRLLGGVRKTRIYEYVYSGDLTRVKVGGRACITTESIDRLVDRLMQQAA